MNGIIWALASSTLLAMGQVAHAACVTATPPLDALTLQAETHTQAEPKIHSARLKGRKLILTGENFEPDAVIMVNGVAQKTRNDPDLPTMVLVSKNAGKTIATDEVVKLQVQNSEGLLSTEFFFYTGLTLTVYDDQKTIRLKVGERFLLILLGGGYECNLFGPDPTIVTKLSDVPSIVGAQGVFQAVHSGQAKISASCTVPCRMPPNCPVVPPLAFMVSIIVE